LRKSTPSVRLAAVGLESQRCGVQARPRLGAGFATGLEAGSRFRRVADRSQCQATDNCARDEPHCCCASLHGREGRDPLPKVRRMAEAWDFLGSVSALGWLGQIRLRRGYDDVLLLHEVAHGDRAVGDACQRAVAAVLGQPLRASDRRRGVGGPWSGTCPCRRPTAGARPSSSWSPTPMRGGRLCRTRC